MFSYRGVRVCSRSAETTFTIAQSVQKACDTEGGHHKRKGRRAGDRPDGPGMAPKLHPGLPQAA